MSIADKLITIAENEQKVYHAGKQAEYNKFWDIFQENGLRNNYQSVFDGAVSKCWTDANYNPKYPITIGIISGGNLMYRNCLITDTKVPIIYADGLTGTISTVFSNAGYLKTIPELHVVEGLTYTVAFQNLKALEDLTVTGVIGGDGFNVQWSTLLSKASITSIINALSSTTTGLTVTLSLAAVNTAFETSTGANNGSASTAWTTLIATKTNWTISLV